MNSTVHFAPALGAWVTEHLDLGASPASLIDVLEERRVARPAALAIVDAFVRARRFGATAPVDTVQIRAADGDAAPYRADPPRLPVASSIATFDRVVRVAARAERPTLAVLADVLDQSECATLIEMARDRLKPSTVVDPVSGRDVVASARRSSGMFFRPGENSLVARLDRRLAEVMAMPSSHGEGLQVLHYPVGAGSEPHFDFLTPGNDANRASIARSGQRVATLVAYLNEVAEGGETLFPAVNWSVSPQRGHAVAFEYGNAAGEVDEASLHASAPVRSGEKWALTKWLRARPFVSA